MKAAPVPPKKTPTKAPAAKPAKKTPAKKTPAKKTPIKTPPAEKTITKVASPKSPKAKERDPKADLEDMFLHYRGARHTHRLSGHVTCRSSLDSAEKDGDMIQAEGLVRLCEDLGVDPSDIAMVRRTRERERGTQPHALRFLSLS